MNTTSDAYVCPDCGFKTNWGIDQYREQGNPVCIDCDTDMTLEKKTTLVGDYLVAKWGYSMILAGWVKVIKVSPKSLVVEQVKGHTLTDVELTERKLSPGFLQCYSSPTSEPTGHNGYLNKSFRIYQRDDVYVGTPSGMCTKLYFQVWDGQPEFEDHCD